MGLCDVDRVDPSPRDSIRVVFAGGGTGGHLFPGLALAERLASRIPSIRITFAGTGKEFERRHVAAAGFEQIVLPCRPRPRGPRQAVGFLLEHLAGVMAARRILTEQQFSAVVGLGGYASVPMARAAVKEGVPLVLLEQNALPGRATRWLARKAAMVCLGLSPAKAHLRCRCPVRVTGTPLRAGFTPSSFLKEGQFVHKVCHCLPASSAFAESKRHCLQASSGTLPLQPPARADAAKHLVVLGGSGGARMLNEAVPRALYKIGSSLGGWEVVHQTGEAGILPTRDLYRKLGLRAEVVPFVHDMPRLLGGGGLAVCRAGGTTLAELAAAAVPAVLLPYPHATDDHQRRNAEVFQAAGGAVILDQRDVSGRLDDRLAGTISELMQDRSRREGMSAAMGRLGRPHAADEVADLIVQLIRPRAQMTVPASVSKAA